MDNDLLLNNNENLDEKTMKKLLMNINNLEKHNLNTKKYGYKQMSEKIVSMIKASVKILNEANDVD